MRWLRQNRLILGLAAAALAVCAVMMLKPRPQADPLPEAKAPVVRVTAAKTRSVSVMVHSQGTVAARMQSTLTAEVSGRVRRLDPAFCTGGFVRKGNVLLEIDAHDYLTQREQARAEVVAARLALAEELALADQARIDWKDLSNGPAPPLALRQPQLDKARADLNAAEALAAKAERDVAATRIRAPYDCLVSAKSVGLGQYVQPGTPLADIFAVDRVEVNLPVTSQDLALLDLPLIHLSRPGPGKWQGVTLTADLAGAHRSWQARIVRSEGVFDPRNRTINLVAEVQDPYALGENAKQFPLPVGLFVQARIRGRTVADVLSLPANALHEMDVVWIVDSGQRLRKRRVEVVYADKDEIFVRGELAGGEHVCLTALEYLVDGMLVRPDKQTGVGENRRPGKAGPA